MAVTRIKNNQITDSTITGAKIANTTLTGGLFATSLTLNSEVSIVGNLSVTGTTSTVSSTNTFINDPLVVYNNGYTGDLSNYSIGLLVNRNLAALAELGSVNVAWVWDEAQGAFVAIATTDTGSGVTSINNSGYANVKVGYQEVTDKVTAAELNTTLEYVTNSLTTTLVATNFSSANVDINGGAIDGATIGAASATTGVFTTISADGITATTGNAQIWYATGLNSTTGNITTLTAPTINAGTTTSATVNATTGNVTTLTAGSLAVSDLTNNRVVIAGTSGELEDDANFTWDGTQLLLTGLLRITGNIMADDVAIDGSNIGTPGGGDLTIQAGGGADNVIIKNSQLIEGAHATTLDAVTLNSTAGNITTLTSPTINAIATTSTTVNATTGNVTGLTAGSATVSDLTNNRVVIAGTSGVLEDDANFTWDGTDLNLTGGLNVTGDLAVDNIAIDGNAITSTDTDGDITLTPNGSGEVVISAGLATTLNAATATAVTLNSTAGNITTLTSPTINAIATTSTTLNATTGNITTLTSPTIDAQTTTTTGLNSTTGNITTLTAPTIDAYTTTSTTVNATTGNVTTLTATNVINTTLVATNFSSANVDINGGAIDATPIGAASTSTGAFTALATSGNTTVTSTQASGNAASGALVVAGGVGVGGALNVGGSVVITGDLTVEGDTTTLNVATLTVEDKNIVLASGAADAATANGAGITVDGADATLTYANADDSWNFNKLVKATTGSITTLTSTNVINTTLVATNFSSANVRATGGYVDNVHVGANVAATGAFTTLSASGTLTVAQVDATILNSASLNTTAGNITTLTSPTVDAQTTTTTTLNATAGNITTLTSPTIDAITTTSTTVNATTGNVTGLTAGSATVSDLTDNRVVIAGTAGALEDDANFTWDGTDLNLTGGLNVTGDLAVDNIAIDGNGITSTDTNGDINITPNGTGEVVISAGLATTLNAVTVNPVTLNATTGNVTTLTATNVINTTLVATNFSSGNVDVNGGAVDGTPIGAASASTGAFTTLSASGTSNVATVNATILNGATVNATDGNITTLTSPTVDAQTTTTTTLNATTGNITTLTAPTIHAFTVTSTTVNSTSGNITTLTGTTVNAQTTTSTGVNATNGNVTTLVATNFSSGNVDINGGAVDGATIGAASASTGAFTSLSASGVSTLAGNIVGTSGIASTSDITGALVLTGTGGAGIGGNINVGGGALLNTDQTANYDVKVYGANDTSLLWARAASGYDQVLIGNSASVSTLVTGAKLQINTTDSIMIPTGTTAQRPGSVGGTDTAGMIRFNTSIADLEFYNGSEWTKAGSTFTILASDAFDGDDSTTAFTIGAAATTAGVIASINGVLQLPTTAYSVSGTTITFTEAPATGDKIEVRRIITTSTVAALESPNGFVQVETADTGVKFYAGAGATTLRWTIDTDGHLIPAANSTQNIGSSSARLGTLYVTDLVTGNQGDLRFNDADSSNFVAFQAPATVSSNITWTLPAEDASVSGYALVSDGSSTLSWAAAGATITQDEATNTNFNLYFAAATSGALTSVNYDSGVHYNPSTGALTSATFAGAVTGNVTGDVTGQLTAGNVRVGVTGTNEIDTTSGGLTLDSASGTVTVDDNLVVSGDFTVNGTTTTINSTTLTVDDKNIVLASGAADAATANGAGITVDGASATLTYANTGDKWAFNKPIDVTGTGTFSGNVGASHVNVTNTVQAATVNATTALTAVAGTFSGNVGASHVNVTNTVQAATVNATTALTAVAGTFSGNVGASHVNVTNSLQAVTVNATTAVTGAAGTFSGNVTASYFIGTATQSLYADLAENYQADASYEAGAVLEFGGSNEVTVATVDSRRVAGVVSTNPAHLMNGGLTGSNVVALALTGRVPCLAIGPVVKGDMMVSAGHGYAKASDNPSVGAVIGKSLETLANGEKGVIEVVVGRV
jgi:trimeric autotransporter adhesin